MKDKKNKVKTQTVTEEKDLGVYCTGDLKPNKQCITAAAQARRITGMVCRHLKRLDNDSLLIYKSYDWPYLEYCIQTWSPHLLKDIEVLERVHKPK